MRLIKLTLSLGGCVLTLLLFVLGNQFSSYLRTAAGSVQENVQDAVPIEFELRRARDLIDEIMPQLRSQIRSIATQEVEIARLEQSLQKSVAKRDRDRDRLIAARAASQVTLVSLDPAIDASGREPAAGPCDTDNSMRRQFESLQSLEATIAMQREVLQSRRSAMMMAGEALRKTRHRKAQLEQKVALLTAKHQWVEASRIEAVAADAPPSQMTDADALLSKLEIRLAVDQRVATRQREWSDPTSELASLETKGESTDWREQMDEYLDE